MYIVSKEGMVKTGAEFHWNPWTSSVLGSAAVKTNVIRGTVAVLQFWV
jgi:hypothetical protein